MIQFINKGTLNLFRVQNIEGILSLGAFIRSVQRVSNCGVQEGETQRKDTVTDA